MTKISFTVALMLSISNAINSLEFDAEFSIETLIEKGSDDLGPSEKDFEKAWN